MDIDDALLAVHLLCLCLPLIRPFLRPRKASSSRVPPVGDRVDVDFGAVSEVGRVIDDLVSFTVRCKNHGI